MRKSTRMTRILREQWSKFVSTVKK